MNTSKIRLPLSLQQWVISLLTMIKVNDNGQALIIGGTARYILNKVIGGFIQDKEPADIDFTVVGSSDFEYTHADVDIEYDAGHTDIDSYMSSRDITINQVAVDGEFIYATKKCLRDSIQGRIRPVGNKKDLWEEWDSGKFYLSHRSLYRAVRFAAQYNCSLTAFILAEESWHEFHFALQGWKSLKRDKDVLFRYLDILDMDVEDFRSAVEDAGLIETDLILEYLESIKNNIPPIEGFDSVEYSLAAEYDPGWRDM